MVRTLIALTLGVLIGVGAMLILQPSRLEAPALGEWRPRVSPAAPSTSTAAVADGETGENFYRRLADASAGELAAMITRAAGEAPSTDRDLALAVLLRRYAELDAVRAVRLAREARVGGTALSTVYGAWARADPVQTLAALSTVDDIDVAANVALALIVALGNDAEAVRRVAAILVSREQEEPFGSITRPIAPVMSPAGPAAFVASRNALALTAQLWADLDPQRALAVAGNIDDERIRVTFEAAALRILARTAPDAAFAHLGNLRVEFQQVGVLSGIAIELARADPERLLTASSGWPADVRQLATSVATQQLAERDPLAALRYVERMPAGPERQSMMQVIARNYGKRDAASALAWARSVPGQQLLVESVIAGVAEQDAERAIDLVLGLSSPMERMRAMQFAVMTGARQDSTMEAIANRLRTIDDPQLRDMSFNVVSMWASRSPDGAMRWLLVNGRDASRDVFRGVAHQLSTRDPRSAIAYSAQIPAAARESWIHGVAQGYGEADAQGAVDWVRQFRGEPWYESAAAAVAMSAAQRDGATAARLVDDLDIGGAGVEAQRLVSVLVTNWANQDPAAAANWVVDRGTELAGTSGLSNVIGIWSNQNFDAARQWTLRLPQGAQRDTALTPLLTTSAHSVGSGFDAGLLSAFASDASRQQALLQVLQGLAHSNPAQARSIADIHLTDPAMRAQAERLLDAARNPVSSPYPIQFQATDAINVQSTRAR